MIEKIKLTPRIWNTNKKFTTHLRYISSILNIPINIIEFKRTAPRNYNTNFQCGHTKNCYFPVFKFQNPNIRFRLLCETNEIHQINILEFKSEYYFIASTSCAPLLINQQHSNFEFHYNSESVTLEEIKSILKNEPIAPKSFSIALYSTESYVKKNHTKIIQRFNIRFLESESSDMLHLFLTPHIDQPTFDIYKLEPFPSNINFNLKNILSNTHLTEGEYIQKSSSRPNKTLLNQDYCICEHPDTGRYFTPSNITKSFKPLGASFFCWF
jgi:hypothetical protein